MKSRYLLFASFLVGLGLTAPTAAQIGYSFNDDDFNLYSIDLSDGTATVIGPTGFAENGDLEGMAFNFSGTILYGANQEDTLFTCDVNSGLCTLVGPFNFDANFEDLGLAFVCDGRLFLSSADSDDDAELYLVDPATGQATLVGSLGERIVSLTSRKGDTLCPSGLFGIGDNDQAAESLFCIDVNTPTAVLLAALDQDIDGEPSIEFDSNGVLWATAEEIPDIFQIDLATGAVTEAAYDLQPDSAYVTLAIPSQGSLCAGILAIPTVSPWGLAALVALLGVAGAVAVRRMRVQHRSVGS